MLSFISRACNKFRSHNSHWPHVLFIKKEQYNRLHWEITYTKGHEGIQNTLGLLVIEGKSIHPKGWLARGRGSKIRLIILS